MNTSELFGELRAIVHQPPSAVLWSELCSLIGDVLPDVFVDTISPYLEEHLSGWGEDVRVAPASWVSRSVAGEDVPQLYFTTMELDVSALSDDAPEPDVATLIEHYMHPYFRGLRALRAHRVELAGELFARMCDTPTFERLEVLDVTGAGLGAEGARALAQSKHLKHLREVRIGWCNLEGAGALALANSHIVRAWETLDIEGNGIQEAEAMRLLRNPHFVNLRDLKLGWNDIGDGGMKVLAEEAVFTEQLVGLGLENNSIGDPGVQALLSSPRTRSVRELDLYNNELTDASARVIAECPYIVGVEDMDLSENHFTALGRDTLLASKTLHPDIIERVSTWFLREGG
ncbi:MAG: hypothetical protein AAGI01_06345 [Myxococcota bacterium]